MSKDWKEKIKEYCKKYNIPIFYLAETMYEPKVIPMIRGKAFEFSVMMALQNFLPQKTWKITKVPMNAQQGIHDVDVLVTNKSTKKTIRVECKLAKKESFRLSSNNNIEIKVKCMRSRTLGTNMVRILAPKLGKSIKQLTVHNDQYLPIDFDVVITSIGNAFYRTNPNSGIFEWNPNKQEKNFLQFLSNKKRVNLKDFAFQRLYIAKVSDLVISKNTGVTCTRRRCLNKNNCGFIPNYPIIKFVQGTKKPINGWLPLEESLSLFKKLV